MLRFGIVGTGRISDWVLKGAVQDPRFKAVAVCSRDEGRAMAFIARHPEAFDKDAMVFTDIKEMSDSPDIDAIYIGTPNSTHHDYTLTALNAGKHVLCEKPISCNASELRDMIEASRRNGKALMEAMISTLNPNFKKVRELMSNVGTIRHYNSSFCQYSSKYDALKAGVVSNSFNPQMGGGALADIGVYTTFPAVALLGRPDSVKSNLVKFPTQYGDTDVQGTIELSYDSCTAVLSFSKVVDSHLQTEICGEDGNILMDAIHICREVVFAPHQAPSSGRGPAASMQSICSGLDKDEYFYEFEEFIDVVERGDIESEVNSHDISLINRELMDIVMS